MIGRQGDDIKICDTDHLQGPKATYTRKQVLAMWSKDTITCGDGK